MAYANNIQFISWIKHTGSHPLPKGPRGHDQAIERKFWNEGPPWKNDKHKQLKYHSSDHSSINPVKLHQQKNGTCAFFINRPRQLGPKVTNTTKSFHSMANLQGHTKIKEASLEGRTQTTHEAILKAAFMTNIRPS